ncbi:MAG TPA: FKBP-type peptidyl-prolyl cis-trans isomerase [Opitutaceae bacterium]|nr:FKBP-type peptidyl-prolyl cis-trans isomerase [Opitutaceae bacterium]
MRNASVLLRSLAGLLAAAGCAKKEAPPAEPAPAAVPKPPPSSTEEVWTAEQIAFIKEKFGELERTPSGMYFKILQPGTGDAKPARANLCTVQYRGSFFDGRVFDESYRRGQPFKFRVGVRQVIKGWDEAVADMHKGEKRLIVVPYWLGYGAQGKIPVIMPRTPLVFEIELLDWETTTKVPTGP